MVALSHHVISRNTKNDLLPVGPDTASQPDPRKRSLKTYNKHQSAVEVKLFDPDPNDAPRPASPRLLTPSPPTKLDPRNTVLLITSRARKPSALMSRASHCDYWLLPPVPDLAVTAAVRKCDGATAASRRSMS